MKEMEEIYEAFNVVHKSVDIKNQTEWTSEFMYALAKIGSEKGYKIYTHSIDAKKVGDLIISGGEWLFDLCWSIEGPGKDDWMVKYKGLHLIFECEWNMRKGEIIYDFQKLAVAKADIKIILIQYKDNLDEISQWCRESVDESLRNGETVYYLFGSSMDKDEIEMIKLW